MASFFDRVRGVQNTFNPARATPAGNLSILDVYSAHHDDLGPDVGEHHSVFDTADEPPPPHMGTAGRCWWRFKAWAVRLVLAPSQWIFLMLLGVLTAVAGFIIDGVSSWMLQARIDNLDPNSGVLSFMWWSLWCILFAMVAASVGHFISPHAQGSGIPELKSILSGTPTLSHYLSFPVLLAKVVGVVSALGGGLAIGKEGPFVHVASILAHKMWKLPWFSHAARVGRATRNQNLAAAVAAGVTAVFGAPVGGVLFSIEVTATYYLVSNLWRAFICSIFCVVAFELINAFKDDELFADTHFRAVAHSGISWELIAFSILGVLCGLMSSLLVHVVTRVLQLRREFVKTYVGRYGLTAAVAFLCAVLTFPAAFLRKPYRGVINDMFSVEASPATSGDGPSGGDMHDWDDPTRFTSLLVYMLVAFITTPLSLALPIPCGLFTPFFAFGAVFGRAFGQMAASVAPHAGVVPGAYAVVGAAAFTSGATQSLSTTVIVFELTGQLHHMVPVLLATVIAYSIAGTFSISIYDVLLQLKGLPYLPRAHGKGLYNKTAKDIMHRDVRFLKLHAATYRDADRLLKTMPLSGPHGQRLFEFPVVEDDASMLLVGSVLRVALADAINRRRQAAQLRSGVRLASSGLPIGALSLRKLGSGSAATRGEGEDYTTPLTTADYSVGDESDEPSPSPRGNGGGNRGSGSGAGDGGKSSDAHKPSGVDVDDDAWMDERLPMDDWTPSSIRIDRAPYQLAELTPLPKVHFLFATCQFAQVSVTHQGRLVGVILKADLSDPHRMAIAAQQAGSPQRRRRSRSRSRTHSDDRSPGSSRHQRSATGFHGHGVDTNAGANPAAVSLLSPGASGGHGSDSGGAPAV